MVRLTKRRARRHPKVDIPWLADIAQSRPQTGGEWNPFGNRQEEAPSEDVTQRVLDAHEQTPSARLRPQAIQAATPDDAPDEDKGPGLHTRR